MHVTKWNRFGHRRLYVTDDDGQQLGWWDLAAGEPHPESPELEERVRAAVQLWEEQSNSSNGAVTPSQDGAPRGARGADSPSPPNAPQSAAIEDVDLAGNVAGHQLGRQIHEAHAAGQRPTLLRRLVLGKDAWSTWERGAIGERLVEAELVKLEEKDPRWSHINSIPVGTRGSDIDHLLIGPAGVFTINAKNHHGCKAWVGGDCFMVNGQRVHHVRNARHEATRASRLLSEAVGWEVPVRGWVVTVRCDLTIKQQPEDVHVMTRRDVVRHARRLQSELDESQTRAIVTAARRAATWIS